MQSRLCSWLSLVREFARRYAGNKAAHIAIMHALEIDPVSIITLVWAGVTSHLAHQFDQAIKHYQSALELDRISSGRTCIWRRRLNKREASKRQSGNLRLQRAWRAGTIVLRP